MNKRATKYSKEDIVNECKMAFGDKSKFYEAKFLCRTGKTRDRKEYISEIIAEYILDNLDAFSAGIHPLKRTKSYKPDGHDGDYSMDTVKEKIIAKKLYCSNRNYPCIGRVIDYEIPLSMVGKTNIDLISYDGNTLHLLELKEPDNKRETMLRCVLEGYTYLRFLDKSKLLEDYNLPSDTLIQASPLVFKGGEQWEEYKDNRQHLLKLMEKLDSTPYFIEEQNGAYNVFSEREE